MPKHKKSKPKGLQKNPKKTPLTYEDLFKEGLKFQEEADEEKDPQKKFLLLSYACEKYQQAHDLHPTLPISFNWGTSLFHQAQIDTKTNEEKDKILREATEKFEQALVEFDPMNNEILGHQGNTFQNLADLREQNEELEDAVTFTQLAAERFEKSIESVQDMDIKNNWANSLSKLGKLTNEIQPFEKSIQIFQEIEQQQGNLDKDTTINFANTLFQKCEILYEIQPGNLEEIQTLCLKSMEYLENQNTKESDFEILCNIGDIFVFLGNVFIRDNYEIGIGYYEKGIQNFENSCQQNENFYLGITSQADTYFELSKIMKEKNDEKYQQILQKSFEFYQKSLQLDPKNFESLFNTACIFGLTEKENQCQKYLTKCLQHHENTFTVTDLEDKDFDLMRDKEWFKNLNIKVLELSMKRVNVT